LTLAREKEREASFVTHRSLQAQKQVQKQKETKIKTIKKNKNKLVKTSNN